MNRSLLKADPVLIGVVVASTILSIGATAYFYHQGDTLAYKDAISHMQIARRVLHNPSGFSLAQLGGVWLPGPHVIMLPLVQNDWMYYSGIGGTVISMVSFVFCCVLIYRIVTDLVDEYMDTRSQRVGGAVAALVFALNPNVLYMQSTPMTEMMLYAGLAGMVLAIQRWVKTEQAGYIAWAAFAAFFATMTRYEAWVMVLLLLGLMFLIMLVRVVIVRSSSWKRMEDVMLAASVSMLFGVFMWVIWNLIIFKNPIYFQRGEYANPSLWVGEDEAAVGNWGVAAKTYWYAVHGNTSIVILLFALIVAIVVSFDKHLWPRILPLYSMGGFAAFFVYSLYAGQRPLHVEQIHGALYNVRFGLVMLLPVACVVGLGFAYLFYGFTNRPLTASLSQPKTASVPLLGSFSCVILAVVLISPSITSLIGGPAQVATWREPLVDQSTAYSRSAAEVSEYLAANYDQGLVLMESYGNELVLTGARIDFSQHVYEGNNKDDLWKSSLQDPVASGIRVVIMRRSQDGNDLVYNTLSGTSQLNGHFRQVFANNYYEVWWRCQTGRCT